MSACNHAISSARTTMESLFSFKAVIGLGIAFPFNFAAREEMQITVATPPNSCPRATFRLNSSSDPLSSSSSSVSPSLRPRSSKSKLYRGIGLGHPISRGAPLDEAALPTSKRSSIANTGALPTKCQGKLAYSNQASDPDFKEYTGVNLHAPPTIRTKGRDLGASPQWSERNITSGMPSTSPPVLPRFSSTNPEPRRHLRKQPAGLGLGHPTTNSLQTASPPPPPSEPSGMGMLTSSLSISSELCRLTSQCVPKPPPRSQPHPYSQQSAHAQRLFSSKMTFVTLSKFSKRSLYTIPESSTGSPDQGHDSFIRKGGQCSDGRVFEGSMVHSFGRTLF
ncbi:hypothetical protein IW261DRAFT_458872 [Armillaria novae-zelandiae]|uniref:Uncharacterized protein n=1 Tax=Armillaria novae-zelandiae TaxID=153914 RepID=A0AA39P1W1_9AGAR|nr:hypothetical protein IW261DRAFT_458872 [Armillaria novae-zelandiae]